VSRCLLPEFSDDNLSRLWLTARVMDAVDDACVDTVRSLKSENAALRTKLALTRNTIQKYKTAYTPPVAEDSDDTSRGSGMFRRGSWTMAEHDRFLEGLRARGPGNWSVISREYVCTRSPTQVASHAQKYLKRMKKIGAPAY